MNIFIDSIFLHCFFFLDVSIERTRFQKSDEEMHKPSGTFALFDGFRLKTVHVLFNKLFVFPKSVKPSPVCSKTLHYSRIPCRQPHF